MHKVKGCFNGGILSLNIIEINTIKKLKDNRLLFIAGIAVLLVLIFAIIAMLRAIKDTNNTQTAVSGGSSNGQSSDNNSSISINQSDIDPTKSYDYLHPLPSIKYDELFRNSDKYNGKFIRYQGEVIQALGDPGEQQLRVNITRKGDSSYYYYDDTVYIFSSCPERNIENDIIEFTAQANGTITYQSALGGEITIPQLKVWECKLVGRAN